MNINLPDHGFDAPSKQQLVQSENILRGPTRTYITRANRDLIANALADFQTVLQTIQADDTYIATKQLKDLAGHFTTKHGKLLDKVVASLPATQEIDLLDIDNI